MPALHRHYLHIFAALLALLVLPATASIPFGDLRFDRVTSANGLNVAFSTAIAQDSQGYMWFGTQSGMIRYDGFRSRVYKNCSADPGKIKNATIHAFHKDRQSRFWIGTDSGLCKYDAEHDRFLQYLETSPISADNGAMVILKIVDDGSGNLWLATKYGLVHFFPDSGKYTIAKFEPETIRALNTRIGMALERDATGNIWLGNSTGLYLLKAGATTLQHFRLDSAAHPEPHHNEVIALRLDSKQTLWIGTRFGLETLQTNSPELTRQRFESEGDAKNGWITDILEDNQGDMWMATQNDGVFNWNRQTQKFTAYRHDPLELHSIVGNEIIGLYQDMTGTIWIATPIDGISKVELNSGNFKHISQDTHIGKGLADNKIRAIFNGPDEGLWLGTLGGAINSYNPKSGVIKSVGIKSGLIENSGKYNTIANKTFTADGKEKLWVLTESGIRHFDLIKQRFADVAPAGAAPDAGAVISIDEDKEGDLWALTRTGLYRLGRNTNTWQRFEQQQNTLTNPAEPFTAMHEDPSGKFWVATLNKIELFNKSTGQFKEFAKRPHTQRSSNPALMVILFTDSKGNLWVDNETGLSRLEINGGRVTRVQNFATETMVDAILEDQRGEVWISTDDGISHFDPITSKLVHFNSLEDESVSGYFVGSALLANDGVIYFGGPHGLTAFRSDNIDATPRPAPPVLITDLQIFNRSVTITADQTNGILSTSMQTTNAVTLPYSAAVFSIEFAALDYENPSANRYAYQLQGFDPGWRYTDASNRLATYTNLNPGHYVFRVRAADSDGIWNNAGATLAVTISPPYWKTWWFRMLSLLLLFGALIALYRIRIRGLLRQKAALESVVHERTQEIIQQKNVIEDKNRQLETVNQLQEEHQSELTHFLAVASHDLRQPIHALNIYLGAITEMDIGGSARAIFDKMAKCVQIMDEMFLALLDLSLLEAHAVKPRIEHFSIATILSLIEVEFAPQAHAAGLALTVEHCNEWIDSDANLIKQILANLTANAVRYTKAGSITLRCVKQDGWLRISVQDTGIGISPGQQSIVFTKFHQLGNADREKAKGIGLGLAIVKRLCELLSLPLGLSSVPGQGSTFTIDLPLSRKGSHDVSGTVSTSHSASLVSLSNILVVVIDDDVTILDAMRGLLEKWGCAVTTAATAKEAISLFGTSSRAPDVLICDYRLHVNEDGIDTINMLRNEFNQEIPALLITGDTSSDIIGALQTDNIHVMHKPLRAEVLRDTLVRLLYPDAAYMHGVKGSQSDIKVN